MKTLSAIAVLAALAGCAVTPTNSGSQLLDAKDITACGNLNLATGQVAAVKAAPGATVHFDGVRCEITVAPTTPAPVSPAPISP